MADRSYLLLSTTRPSVRAPMSCVPAASDVCANCGKHGSDGVKLKNCKACRLVKYCGVDCQRAHRKQHKKACKRRSAELKDEQLYSQGHDRPEGDFCPICTLPIPIPMNEHATVNVCCMKCICDGCVLASRQRGIGGTCPFCRTPMPSKDDDASSLAMMQKRIDAGDADAIEFLARSYHHGEIGLEKNLERAIELWTDAAELGSIIAHYQLGVGLNHGYGVEQDKARAVEHWQHAAMKGHIESRHSLGVVECMARNYNLAVKHLLISAKMGYKLSLDMMKEMISLGAATKVQYAEALKGYQEAVEDTKSPARDEAKRHGY